MWTDLSAWLKANSELAGWAQAIGALIAIAVAIYVTNLQARYALKHQDRQTAERVRTLARIFKYWSDTCWKSYAIRERQGTHSDENGLHQYLGEFNHTAGEINKFNFTDAPSERVLQILKRYREMCGALSNYMNPVHLMPANDLVTFGTLIKEIEKHVRMLEAEATRIAK